MLKHKVIKISVVLIVITILSYLIYRVINIMEYKNSVVNILKTLPEFSFKTLDNQNFTNNHIIKNKPTVFIYFNSECDFCHHEAQIISENLNALKDVELLFVSSQDIKVINEFANKYELLNQPNISFLSDNKNIFSKRFDVNSIPYLLIYNKNQELVKKHKGQLKPELISKALISDKSGM